MRHIPKTHRMYERPGVWPAGGVRGWLFVNTKGAWPVKKEWIRRDPKSWRDRFVAGVWRLMDEYGTQWCLAYPIEDPLADGRRLAEKALKEDSRCVTVTSQ